LDGVIPWETVKSAFHLFVDRVGYPTVLIFLEVKNALVHTALGISKVVTAAVVNSVLKNTRIPSVEEICMVTIAGGISVCEHEWLRRVHSFAAVLVKALCHPVYLKEDPWSCLWEIRVVARPTIGTTRREGDV
jgi:hypothetical protein